MDYPIHIAFCVNDGYIQYICVTIKSIIENNKNNVLYFHVLSDYVSRNKRKLLYEVIDDCKNARIEIHSIDNCKLFGLKDSWSIQAWYRIFLPQVLNDDIHRILYLDADTVVTGSLKYLFSMNMNGASIAGVMDLESFYPETFKRCGYDYSKKYVCSGVLLMNLDYWRENRITDKIVNWARENINKIKFPDQDSINFVCQDSKILLPMKYGILNKFFYDKVVLRSEYLSEIKDCLLDPVIIHYAGLNPWKIELAKHLQNEKWEIYNHMLKHPAKRHHITKGMNLVKLYIWNFLHPNVSNLFKAEQKKQIQKILNL